MPYYSPRLSPRGNMTKTEREKLRLKFGGRCAYCGCILPDRWHADHLKPVMRESKYIRGQGFVQTGKMYAPEHDTIDNMMPSCIPCNVNKSDSSLETWRILLERQVEILQKNSAPYRHALRFGLIAETGRKVVFYFEQYVTLLEE